MAYDLNSTFAKMEQWLQRLTTQAIQVLDDGYNGWDKWNSIRDSRSDAAIASSLVAAGETDVTETHIADVRLAFQALKALKDYADNGSPTQYDYRDDLRKFAKA